MAPRLQEDAVESMEQRLQMLKSMMEDEKSKRDAKRRPDGNNWRSARQDGSGTGSKYVENVLKERPAARSQQQPALAQQRQGPAGSKTDGAPGAPRAPSAGRVGRLRAEAGAAAAHNPLSGELSPTPPPPRPGRTGGPTAARRNGSSARTVAAEPAARAEAAAFEPEPFEELGNQTRDISEMFSWRPGDAEPTGDYEVCARQCPLLTALAVLSPVGVGGSGCSREDACAVRTHALTALRPRWRTVLLWWSAITGLARAVRRAEAASHRSSSQSRRGSRRLVHHRWQRRRWRTARRPVR
jgi:hypothetical protein